MRIGFSIILILISIVVSATHNRAGEISYKQLGDNLYEITLVTYTRVETQADRPVLEIDWGDGTIDSLERLETPELVGVDINKNTYTSIHTFPGPGLYKVSLEDPNRNADVVNIPNSVNVPFFIESEIIINPFLGKNNSPILLNPPIEEACLNTIFLHNPSAFDADGDNLVYSLIEAIGLSGEPIPGYTFPEGVSIDSTSGTLTWDKPNIEGEFNFAILIQEYRNGFLIGSIIRDMQVSVSICDNNPPEIKHLSDICIEAGTSLSVDINAYDIDSGQFISLSATGGPITQVNGDLASFSEVLGQDSVSGKFNWNTGCSHVRSSPYQVFFKAQDNDSQVQLVDIQSLNIKVIGPKVKNVITEALIEGINLSWTRSICEEAIGYKIYRKSDSLNWIPDSCEIGIPFYTGYNLIGTVIGRDNSYFIDKEIIEGNLYCYRIVAIFPDGAESIASEESCSKTIEVRPIPLNVDVTITDSTNGEIFIRWKNPGNIDSLNYEGALFYNLYEVVEDDSILIYQSLDINDTTFKHQNLNTEAFQKIYFIELIDKIGIQEKLLSTSAFSTSVFLKSVPYDKSINLTWNYATPWQNDSSVVLLLENGNWIVLDTVSDLSYFHDELINGANYCYRILTLGEYTSNQSDTFILNHSQETCEIPEDISPPCVPQIVYNSDCEFDQNMFSWKLDTNECNGDLTSLNIFFKRLLNDPYTILSIENSPWQNPSFLHENIEEVAGCYAFTATDSVGNESELMNEICFDNCPSYQLPNIFTPNGDNVNDFIIPFPYKYIEGIKIVIYNRWGQTVFKSNNPNVNWDGRHNLTKLKCSEGVYFYTCVVKEKRLSGIENKMINGFIQLIRN